MTEFIEDTNKEGDLVRVIWIDIVEADSGWHDKKEIEDLKPSKITSVGYVMKSTSHYLTIAGDKSTDDEDDLIGRCQVIPRGVILHIKKLEQ